MKFRLPFFLFILSISSSIVFSQELNITGKVLDASKKPIEFANVFAKNRTNESI